MLLMLANVACKTRIARYYVLAGTENSKIATKINIITDNHSQTVFSHDLALNAMFPINFTLLYE